MVCRVMPFAAASIQPPCNKSEEHALLPTKAPACPFGKRSNPAPTVLQCGSAACYVRHASPHAKAACLPRTR